MSVEGGAFSVDWLGLREPADQSARIASAKSLRLRRWAARRQGERSPLQVVDLACGTGANLRALAPLLGGLQCWDVLDRDEALLAAWPERIDAWTASLGASWREEGEEIVVLGRGFQARVRRQRADLSATGLPGVAIGPGALVAGSALLDLVSEPWLRALVDRCTDARASALFALSVDGRLSWTPADPWDAQATRRFSAHQRRDKGFGPALGPLAARRALALFHAAGWRVRQARSDWRLGPGALQAATVAGIAAAAIEQDPDAASAADAWRARRSAPASGARMRVGHVDLLALPPERAGCPGDA